MIHRDRLQWNVIQCKRVLNSSLSHIWNGALSNGFSNHITRVERSPGGPELQRIPWKNEYFDKALLGKIMLYPRVACRAWRLCRHVLFVGKVLSICTPPPGHELHELSRSPVSTGPRLSCYTTGSSKLNSPLSDVLSLSLFFTNVLWWLPAKLPACIDFSKFFINCWWHNPFNIM